LVGRAALIAFCFVYLDPDLVSAFQAQIRDIHVTQGVQSVKWESGNPHGFPPQNGNTVPLIGYRSTAVRVLLDVQLTSGEAAPSFFGELDIRINGQLVNGVPIQAANQPFTPPVSPDIRNENDTLNFIINPPALIFPYGQNLESNDVDFIVRITTGPGGQPELVDEANDLSIVSLPSIDIAAVPVTWVPTNSSPEASFIAPGRGDAFFAAALPIDDSCFRPHVCVIGQGTSFATEISPYRLVQGLSYDLDLDGDGGITGGVQIGDGEVFPLLEDLETWRNFCFEGGGAFCPHFSADRLLFVYGWLPDAAKTDFNGITLPGANVAIGFDSVAEGQGTFAHEFGHMLGLVQGGGHNPCPLANPNCPQFDISPNVGFDVLGRIVNNPPGPLPPAGNGNGVNSRVKGFGLHDLMNRGGGGTLPNRWLTIPTYLTMMDELKARDPRRTASRQLIPEGIIFASASTPPKVAEPMPMTSHPKEFPQLTESNGTHCLPTLRITGTVTKYKQAGNRVIARQAKLNPAFQSDRCWRPSTIGTRTSQLIAEVTMVQSGRDYTFTVPIDARLIIDWIIDPKDPGKPRETIKLGPFEATVPVIGEVVSVRLMDPEKKKTFARLNRTAQKPRVKITTPKPNSKLTSKTEVSWSVSDPDSKPSEFLYHVAYSPDGGANFIPVAVNKRKTQIVFDASKYPPSEGEGVLRIYASDGLNTVTTDVNRLINSARE
jgi:hypothetical protein